MEAPEEIAMASKDNSNINKGKRTKKRLRPQSPTPLAVISNNSIFNGNGSEFDGIPSVLNKNYTQYLSPFSSSSLEYQDSNEKEREEEDMANCLILLAQGRRSESTKQGDDRHDRFTEAASNGTGKAGRYVYECKTCNRTFPSFQALGGHRTSHTKPKAVAAAAPVAAAVVDDKIRQFKALTATITTTTAAALDEEQGQQQFIKTNNVSSLSLQLIGNPNKTKVHECSICGAEFSSGQALGGHMRRHRGSIRSNMVDNIIVNPTLSLTTSMEMESQQPKKSRNASSLDFDLNFPAPEDDDHWESKFPFPSKQQQKRQQQQQKQSPLVFNAPKLVDCHY